VLVIEPMKLSAIVEGGGTADVAGANYAQEGAEEQVAQAEQLPEEGAFDLVGGGAIQGGLPQRLNQTTEVRLSFRQQPLDRTGRLGLVL
jgi:hypothetical protein